MVEDRSAELAGQPATAQLPDGQDAVLFAVVSAILLLRAWYVCFTVIAVRYLLCFLMLVACAKSACTLFGSLSTCKLGLRPCLVLTK